MEDLVLPDRSASEALDIIKKYRAELAEGTAATATALQQVRQQLATLERNQIAYMAQKAVLDALEKDLNAVAYPLNPTSNATT